MNFKYPFGTKKSPVQIRPPRPQVSAVQKGLRRSLRDPILILRGCGGAKRGATASRGFRLSVLLEDGVHGLGALGDHRPELMPVDLLSYRRAGVPDEISDDLDGDVV